MSKMAYVLFVNATVKQPFSYLKAIILVRPGFGPVHSRTILGVRDVNDNATKQSLVKKENIAQNGRTSSIIHKALKQW